MAGLADAVGAINGLVFHRGIPPRIAKYYGFHSQIARMRPMARKEQGRPRPEASEARGGGAPAPCSRRCSSSVTVKVVYDVARRREVQPESARAERNEEHRRGFGLLEILHECAVLLGVAGEQKMLPLPPADPAADDFEHLLSLRRPARS